MNVWILFNFWKKYCLVNDDNYRLYSLVTNGSITNERKSEQAHIPHAPTLLENAVYNEWQFQALGTGNQTKKGI